MKDDKVKVGALWKKEGPSGTYYTGSVDPKAIRDAVTEGKDRLLVFLNGYKETDKQPDLIMYLATANKPSTTRPHHVRDEDVVTTTRPAKDRNLREDIDPEYGF